MRIYRPPGLIRLLYPEAYFSFPSGGRTLYLSFDDGPTDGISQRLLEILEKKGVPATFFVNGNKVLRNTALFESIKSMDHAIGNHGFKHLNGFRTERAEYIDNVIKGAEISGSKYFRPPYGKIRRLQYRELIESFNIVFWSLMPYDFDPGLTESRILKVLKSGLTPGSIIALHDNEKSRSPIFLGEFIEYCLGEGYSFDTLHRLNLVS